MYKNMQFSSHQNRFRDMDGFEAGMQSGHRISILDLHHAMRHECDVLKDQKMECPKQSLSSLYRRL